MSALSFIEFESEEMESSAGNEAVTSPLMECREVQLNTPTPHSPAERDSRKASSSPP
jgi:hypothetical protein